MRVFVFVRRLVPVELIRWGNWKPLGVTFGLVGLLGLSACATTASPEHGLSKDSSPEAKRVEITSRATARWNALVKGDLDSAYNFMSAASRDAIPLATYKGKIRHGGWRSVNIDSVDCEAEVCRVKLMLTYDHQIMKGIQTPITETWLIDKGTAWYVFRE